MATDTTVNNLIINKLTKAQYEAIASPSETEIYLVPDEMDSAPVQGSDNSVKSGGLYTTFAGKQDTITGGASTIASADLTASRALISNSSGKVAISAVTSTELGYLSGATSSIQTQLNGKQETLVSGTNIKTINNESILGNGNITIQGGGSGDVNIIESVKVNGTALTPDSNKAVDITAVPASIVTQDATHRMVSDTEKSTWNSKTDNIGTITGITMNGASKGTSGVVDLGTVITSETALSKGTTTGSGNAVTDISVSGHQITLTKGTTFLTSHQDIKTLNGTALTGTGNITLTGVPAFTSADNGKILGVVNGQLAWITPTTIYTGSGTPSSSQGNDGDIYLQTS